MFRIGSDGAEGLRDSTEENTVNHSLILIGEGCNLFRHGEDNVEVFGGKEFGLAVLESLGLV